jgi:hypothetical protein
VHRDRFRLVANPPHLSAPLLAALFASVALAQCPVTTDPATYPAQPLTYPMTSDRYAVQYQLGNGTWTNARVYISYYGGTMASPYIAYSKYPADESMSFVSIPAGASTNVAVRITKIFGANFPAISQMSVRPNVKRVQISSVSPAVVQLTTATAANFAGDQFILYWNGDAKASGAIQGLAIFLDPPYTRPTGNNVKVVAAPADLAGDLSGFNTLDFEGTVAIGGTGSQVFLVPANIGNVFLGQGAWVQGKLRFTQTGKGQVRKIYGPGVLDASRFNYSMRLCSDPGDPSGLGGYPSLSWTTLPASNGSKPPADQFSIDGVVISDGNFYAVDNLRNGMVNNLKIIGWNGNNDGLGLGSTTRLSNVFVRTGDDSLKLFGDYVTITNATVWQNWNGGSVNLGWGAYSTANDSLIDGLYIVKTDWQANLSYGALNWSLNNNGTNNAVIASLMTPGTDFGGLLPPLFRNIYVEDPPLKLFSLRIMPPACCTSQFNPSLPSVLNLDLESVYTPQSLEKNPIGFENLADGSTLPGSMNIKLTNVMVTQPNGTVTALTAENAVAVGEVATNGAQVNVQYASAPKATTRQPPVERRRP